jgi:tRNA-specific 2-thiouridylase
LTQEQLGRTIFPLGGYRKSELREIASNIGLSVKNKKDSQDICFIPDGDYAAYIEETTCQTFEKGDFLDVFGNRIGCHAGHIRYTVGQRKGLGMGFGKPMYVKSKNPEQNTVTLCGDEELFSKTLDVCEFNWIVTPSEIIRAYVKIRYKQQEQPAKIWRTGISSVHIEFDNPQRAIAKGQAAVLYDGDTVLGGGIIK